MNMGTFKKPKYKPFHRVALGRPALGTYGMRFPYSEDIVAVAKQWPRMLGPRKK